MLVIHPIDREDFPFLLAMKSDPDDVKWSGFATAPDPIRFQDWFEGAIIDPNRRLFGGYLDGEMVAYANFRRDGVWFEPSSGTAANHRGRGYAVIARANALQSILSSEPAAKFRAWIALSNVSAQTSAAKNGFRATDTLKEQVYLYPAQRTEQMRLWLYQLP